MERREVALRIRDGLRAYFEQRDAVTVQADWLEGALDFAGAVAHEEIARHLAGGDIFLNTTSVDNTPVSVLEAMASGLCIVSTNVGGIPFLLEDDREALLVDPDDVGAMSAEVRRLLALPEIARRLSAAARQKAELFDWSVVTSQWKALLAVER